MRGDEAELTAAGGDRTRERSGPRHAAPRKSLLTKLQIPAGKAMALAAMPTAVFVGMGLTPKLALADDQVTNPFAPGPCVTRSDTPEPDASESKSPSATPTPSVTPSAGTTPDKPAETPGTGETPKPGETPDADASSTAPATEPTKEPEAGKPTTPTPDPTESETKNPLDPLGVGEAIKDVFDGPDKETAAPEPSETEAAGDSATGEPAAEQPDDTKPAAQQPAAEQPDATKPDAQRPGADEAKDPAADNPVDDAADKTADAIRDAADKAGAKVEELGDEAKGTKDDADDAADGKADDPAAGADGKEPFPCPTADPEALANAELEQGIPDLPDDPWILESSMLTLRGLDYKGIVEVRTGSGKIKKVLKFTAEQTDIMDLHQKVVGPNGTTAHVQAAAGSKSTLRDGTVTMYTEELKGNLFGLIPITFSPETPPPLNVPIAMFTKVKVTQAGQFGGTLKVPGLHNFYTG
ncbi:hypothetical protein BGM19_25655 [Streptomyces agglomeratus]|uniref:hypothetical protein n=1 Tax=Streptomyces agglomeratus TaxID=285458 RepID=UPI000853F6B7|nr:hypothetical protein [Streptomyces agglomeratus]OEJ53573.1 hypothetical protein BGK72_25055 [Streptomyces agglomeratus]OEJ60892.1 hypothetical protein BGM19_25655 [Streptomyces agglomeratus]